MQIVVGISYREVPGGASGSKGSAAPILTVNRTSPEIYYDYVYDVYDIASQKYVEEAVCANTSPENIISELFDKYQNDILKIVTIPPKTKTLNRNLNPFLEEQREKVVEHFEESLRFIFNLPLSVSSEGPILQNSKIVVFTVVEKTGVAWLYNCKETDDPFVYCKREKDFQLNDIDDSFIDKVFKVFNIEMKDCHVVYNSLGEDSFWCALETKKEIFKSLQKTQVLTLLGDNRHYRATMCARYLAKDPNVKSFIFDKTSSFMDEVGSIDYIGKGLGLPIYLDSFHGDIMGIDLGTTRCVLSITSGKRSSTDVIPIDNSSDLCMPTAISFVQEPPIVGKIAMRQLSVKPKSVIFDAKRAVLPTTPHIQNTSPYVKIDKIWPFGVCRSHDEISFTVEHGKSICQQPEFHNFSLEDITLILLQSIKDASRETRRHAVVTVPYQLEPFREFHLMKQDIEKAAKKANVKLLEIIRETDANLLYYASRHALKGKMNVLVVDIGGGTGILMIYKIFYSSAENVGGRRECFYGRMVDQLLFEKLQNIMRKYYGIDEDKIMKKRFQLLNACQNIKHNLSTVEETELDLSEFDPSVERFHKITREWFENNIMQKVALNPQNNLIPGISEFQVKLEGCKSYCNIDYVFLAGGTCRIPYVQNTIRKVFSDLDSSRIVIDPELEIITAQGALIHGCLVKRKLERPITSIFDRYLHDESDKKGARKEPLSLPQRHNDAPKSDFVPRLPICSACPARAKDIDAPKFEFELLRGCHSTGRRRQFACSEAGARAKEKPLSLPQRHDDDPKSKFVLPVFPEKYSLFSQALRKDQTKENYFISLHLCDPNFDCTYPKTNDNTPDEETDSDEEWDEEWDAVWD